MIVPPGGDALTLLTLDFLKTQNKCNFISVFFFKGMEIMATVLLGHKVLI